LDRDFGFAALFLFGFTARFALFTAGRFLALARATRTPYISL
jgi:hypothetical protein